MKIGIMGGTFDPIHNGHLMLGEYAYRKFDLDKIWFLPNGKPPHKDNNKIGSEIDDRLAMVSAAIEGTDYFELQDYEARRQKVSYSYETMEHFQEAYPEDEFYFIIGADSLFALHCWKHPERLLKTCTILAAFRDDANNKEVMNKKIKELNEEYCSDIRLLETPLYPVSSSELREMISQGEPIKEWVHPEVERMILKNNWYKGC